MWLWLAAILLIGYVLVFNDIAKMYLNSNRTMTWNELYRKLVPAVKIQIET
jgi:hypothetical protein